MDPGRDQWWHEALAEPGVEPLRETPTTDPETPYMVIYTSGTSGRPKGAVHVHGGFPIKAAQDLAHDFDLRPGDRLFWFTDLGWMMGPWAISGALLLGASLVLYEGTPDYPGPDRLWAIAASHGVTHLGLSPTVIRALMAHGPEPVRGHDLSGLRVLGSTGEPWNPEPWWWFFREVGGGRCPIVNYSGGTEVSGGIVSGNLLTPIKPCGFSGPAVGTAADVVGPDGSALRGVVGELAIRAPMPGMTRGFWRDRERYVEAYWARFPGLWVHGDWAIVDQDGHWFIQGRSDDTLKVAGKRVGPAEVEVGGMCGAGGPRGGRHRGAPRGQGRGHRRLLRAWARCVGLRGAARHHHGAGGGVAGQGAQARCGAGRAPAAQDAQRQGHAPRGASRLPGLRSR